MHQFSEYHLNYCLKRIREENIKSVKQRVIHRFEILKLINLLCTNLYVNSMKTPLKRKLAKKRNLLMNTVI